MQSFALFLLVIFGIGATVWLFWSLRWLIQIIANWLIFRKAGESGWKSIIPIYSDYTVFKFSWSTKAFWIMLISEILASIFAEMAKSEGAPPVWRGIVILLTVVFGLVSLIMNLGITYKLSRSFGHGIGFMLGLMIFPTVFSVILGFGSSRYIGKQ